MSYFVIWSNDDTILGMDGPMTKEEALFRVQDKYYGDLPFKKEVPKFGYYEGGGIMIIEGKIVTPKPVDVVTKYEF